MSNKHYTVLGIGIGPFNLGLAALLAPLGNISSLFLDQQEKFDWHPGLMLPSASLQVPFLADLVTMADPTNPYSFLNYLKSTDRIYKFYIREHFNVLRTEYNLYCQWVAAQLTNCRFSQKVISVNYKDDLYEVTTVHTVTGETTISYAEKLVLGTGTQPYVPSVLCTQNPSQVAHSSQYLYVKDDILKSGSVCIVGSGQSAAEIFYDLLPYSEQGLSVKWYTRSPRFFPMEYSRLALELTSPEYIDYFFTMDPDKKKSVLSTQNVLYKGISTHLINSIYETLYGMSTGNKPLNIELRTNMELHRHQTTAEGENELHFTQVESNKQAVITSGYLVLATGYKYHEPAFLQGINHRLNRLENGMLNVARNYTVDQENQQIFVQNAELHTHGFTAPDLGMGPYRNSIIINQIAGRKVYDAEKRIAFQEFEKESDRPVINDTANLMTN